MTRISEKTTHQRFSESYNVHGSSYKSMRRRQTSSSTGNTHLVYNDELKRSHQLFSDIEYGVYLRAKISPSIIDIRENYPLDLEQTRLIVKQMDGVRHPFDFESKKDSIMTFDFLLTQIFEGGIQYIAVNCKSSHLIEWPEDEMKCDPKLLRKIKRTYEKLRIEQEYCRIKGYKWILVTEKGLDQTVTNNLRLFSKLKRPNKRELEIVKKYKEGLLKNNLPICSFSQEFEKEYPTENDGGNYWFRLAVSLGLLGYDFSVPFNQVVRREYNYDLKPGLPEYFGSKTVSSF